MQFRGTIVVAVSALMLATGNLVSIAKLAAEQPANGPAAAGNPLRNWVDPSRPDDGIKSRLSAAARSDLLAQLRSDVAGGDKARAIIAIHRMEKHGAEGAAVLAQLLVADDLPMEIQFPTCNALTAIGPAAVPAILELLQSRHASAQEAAWQLLIRLGPQANAAVPTLLQIIRNAAASTEEQTCAVAVLSTIGPGAKNSLDALLEIAERDDKPSDLRNGCLQAIRAIGAVSAEGHARLVKLLVNENQEPALRVEVATILAEQPSPSPVVLPVLISLLQNRDDWEVCTSACEALGKLGAGSPDAVTTLSEQLEHPGREVRLAAIAACGAMGPSAAAAVPNLLRRIQLDEEADVPEAAAQALLKVDPAAINWLLTDLSRNEQLWQPAVRILPGLGPAGKAAVPELIEMLRKPEAGEFQQQIISLLGNLGPEAHEAVPVLSSYLASRAQPSEIRAQAALALGTISLESVPQLLAALRDEEPEVRIAAAEALGKQNARDKAAIPALLRELLDPNTAEAAVSALVGIGEDSIPAIAKLAVDPNANPDLRRQACLVLGRIGGTAAPILARIVRDTDGELADAAEQALFEVGPKLGIPALIDALQEHDTSSPSTGPVSPESPAETPRVGTVRLLEIIVEMSGGMGGPVGGTGFGTSRTFSNVGSALESPGSSAAGSGGASGSIGAAATGNDAEMQASEAQAREAMAREAMAREAMQRAQEADAKARAGAKRARAPEITSALPPPPAAAAPPAAESPSAAAAPPKPAPSPDMGLKVVKVFYGTDRNALMSDASRLQFLYHGILPSVLVGVITIVVCAIGFFRSRSPVIGGLAVLGVLVTLYLTVVASQQSSESARSLTRRPGPVFGGSHSNELHLGVCEVSIPADHKPGELESPSILRLEFDQDPHKHITLHNVVSYEWNQFHNQLRQCMAEKGNNILVFVHGYNVDFDESARRTAQLANDLEFAGAPVLFSWPSQGNWYEYRQDEKQVELAVPLLKQFLLDVATQSKADSIHLIAHSMGNRALTSALKEIASAAEQQKMQFNQVVLAAPDIDADIFRQRIAPEIITKAQRVTLYASSNDLALTASRTFNSGDLRAGDASRGLVLTPGIETIDASSVDTSLLGHSYYGDSPTVLTDLKELLTSAQPADKRPNLQPMALNQLRYWVFQHPAVAESLRSDTVTR